MDKTTKVFISFIGGLFFFILTKELILSLIICFWLLFALFSLSHQIFLFFAILLLLYYLLFKTISFTYVAIMVILGLLLTIIPKPEGKNKQSVLGFLHDAKTIGFIILSVFLLFALIFSYQTYLKEQKNHPIKEEKEEDRSNDESQGVEKNGVDEEQGQSQKKFSPVDIAPDFSIRFFSLPMVYDPGDQVHQSQQAEDHAG